MMGSHTVSLRSNLHKRLLSFGYGYKRTLATRSASNLNKNLINALRREAPIDIHPEIHDALVNKRPVVALESALITNGMPYPTNLTAAKLFESTVRSTGAIPATIAVINGRVKIGVSEAELEILAESQQDKTGVKVSRRDIAAVISQRRTGGTTCATTLIFSALAGIKVFSTGGLGGVHRGAEKTMDVSADLHELARCPVGLVSGGVKSILDIGRTLEYLETLGVPVITYGPTRDFPAFYSGLSNFKTPWSINDPKSGADLLIAQERIGLQNGFLIAAQLPEKYIADGIEIQTAVEQAIRESEQNGISSSGKDATPWLLARVAELTNGKSLRNNVHLIENTCKIGGEIAVEYAKLQQESGTDSGDSIFSVPSTEQATPPVRTRDELQQKQGQHHQAAELVIVGASALDITARSSKSDALAFKHSTVPGTVTFTPGGVARNIAEAAHRLLSSDALSSKTSTLLVSCVGSDDAAEVLKTEHSRIGLRSDGLVVDERNPTAVCNMFLDSSGGLINGVADMDILQRVDPELLLEKLRAQKPKLVVFDGNCDSRLMSGIVDFCKSSQSQLFFEPTSVSKSSTIMSIIAQQKPPSESAPSTITYTSPNTLELAQMYRLASNDVLGLFNDAWLKVMDHLNIGNEWVSDIGNLATQPACPLTQKGTLDFIVKEGIAQMAVSLLPYFQHVIVKCGDRGVVLVARILDNTKTHWKTERSNPYRRYVIAKGVDGEASVILKHYPAVVLNNSDVTNVTGAGDTLVGALCAGLVKNPNALQELSVCDGLLQFVQEAAVSSLRNARAISPDLGDIPLPRLFAQIDH